MMRIACLALFCGVLSVSPCLAQDRDRAEPAANEPAADLENASTRDEYRDDRSTPVALIASLYNAINRHEYLRAWSYFSEDSGRSDFAAFQSGYESTSGVKLKLGEPMSEGAAGSIYTRIPTVIEATGTDGSHTVFTGCYETRFLQPANQATPPFRPLQIVHAELRPARTKFDETPGHCPAGAN